MQDICIIGTGNCGSAIAMGILLKFSEKFEILFLVDIDKNKRRGEQLDLADADMVYNHKNRIFASEPKNLPHADIYILTAGKNNFKKSRKELLPFNKKLTIDYAKKIANINPDAWLIVVTNPSYELSVEAMKYLRYVIPCGTLLDTGRLQKKMPLSYVTGVHGEGYIINMDTDNKNKLKENIERLRNSAQKIMKLKGYTQWGITAEVIKHLEKVLS